MLKGIEAGADVIDTAMSPLALGTSHPATESMVAALKGTEYDTGLDLVALDEIAKYVTTLREKYLKSGLLNPKLLSSDAKALIYQVPGGMLSNLVSQLKVRARRTSFRRFLPRFRRFAPTADFRLLSLRRRKSSEPKRFSTSFSASGIRRSPRNLKAS